MPEDRSAARVLAPAASAAAVYALWLRSRLQTWGATGDEVAGDYPGDELIPDPVDWATMATTLPAPPESVWPWLVQMGGDRGGWYSRDWLDNNGKPSADRIVPEWQDVVSPNTDEHPVADRMGMALPGRRPGNVVRSTRSGGWVGMPVSPE